MSIFLFWLIDLVHSEQFRLYIVHGAHVLLFLEQDIFVYDCLYLLHIDVLSEPNMFVGACNISSLLKYNKLPAGCQVPSWICCNLEGNGRDASNLDFNNLAEEDAFDAVICRADASRSCTGKGTGVIYLVMFNLLYDCKMPVKLTGYYKFMSCHCQHVLVSPQICCLRLHQSLEVLQLME